MRRDEDRAQAREIVGPELGIGREPSIGCIRVQPMSRHEGILRHAGNRLTMQTAAMERVPDSLVPLWVISARPMEPGTAARIHGIYNARE
jgi:hypothetical protein